jgi:C2H2 type zinc finger protein
VLNSALFASGDDKSARKDDTTCPYCQRRFSTPDELNLHIVTRHTNTGIKREHIQTLPDDR